MGEWKGTRVTNLVRRGGRVYYAQVKIAGKVYRRSLETEKLDIAKIKLPIVMGQIKAEVGATKGGNLATLGGALELWHAQQLMRPELKSASKKYNARLTETLRETLPLVVHDTLLRAGSSIVIAAAQASASYDRAKHIREELSRRERGALEGGEEDGV